MLGAATCWGLGRLTNLRRRVTRTVGVVEGSRPQRARSAGRLLFAAGPVGWAGRGQTERRDLSRRLGPRAGAVGGFESDYSSQPAVVRAEVE